MIGAVDEIEVGITPVGNINITSAGTADVTNYATATVPQGSATGPTNSYATSYSGTGTYNSKLTVLGNVDTTPIINAGFINSASTSSRQVTFRTSIPMNPSTSTVNNSVLIPSGYYSSASTVTVPSQSPVIETLSITANGTYTAPSTVDGYSPVTVNVSGGGGASNVVIGTFNISNATLDITLPYSGDGYPIFISICPSAGAWNSDETGGYYSLVHRYAVGFLTAAKSNALESPRYRGVSQDQYMSLARYKSSASNASSLTSAANNAIALTTGAAPTGSYGYTVASFKSKNVLSIITSDTSYGFAKNIEYKYCIVYSS